MEFVEQQVVSFFAGAVREYDASLSWDQPKRAERLFALEAPLYSYKKDPKAFGLQQVLDKIQQMFDSSKEGRDLRDVLEKKYQASFEWSPIEKESFDSFLQAFEKLKKAHEKNAALQRELTELAGTQKQRDEIQAMEDELKKLKEKVTDLCNARVHAMDNVRKTVDSEASDDEKAHSLSQQSPAIVDVTTRFRSLRKRPEAK